jgi:pyridoxal phosphate enzyme (YggS family)
MGIYRLGHRIFAENRAQELLAKADVLPHDIEWHLIGHLQTNKVRDILPVVTCIQSLDSTKLWKKISEEGAILGKTTDCLLQIKIAREETKFGWAYTELVTQLQEGIQQTCNHVNIRGVMGMATLTEDNDLVRNEMQQLARNFHELKDGFFAGKVDFDTLSMGMSGDYEIALEEGSTMVRIGSLLFSGE